MIRQWLLTYKKKTITLEHLQQQCPSLSYDSFQSDVRALEAAGILVPVRASGRDFGGLARKYFVRKGRLFTTDSDTIHQEALALGISGRLDVSWYYEHPRTEWQRDKERIAALSQFLQQPPPDPASLQQRSYDIFHDEKFLLDDGGLLSRLHLTKEDLAITSEADPLMLALQPRPTGNVRQHLIVENKAPWLKLFPHLSQTSLTSLVLGYGWKILANIDLLPTQCGYPEDKHIIWYFGDFDWEGLKIWHDLTQQTHLDIRLAVPFYRAFLTKEASIGKTNQEMAPDALEAFLSHFTADEAAYFRHILTTQGYYPQEALTLTELLTSTKELTDGT